MRGARSLSALLGSFVVLGTLSCAGVQPRFRSDSGRVSTSPQSERFFRQQRESLEAELEEALDAVEPAHVERLDVTTDYVGGIVDRSKRYGSLNGPFHFYSNPIAANTFVNLFAYQSFVLGGNDTLGVGPQITLYSLLVYPSDQCPYKEEHTPQSRRASDEHRYFIREVLFAAGTGESSVCYNGIADFSFWEVTLTKNPFPYKREKTRTVRMEVSRHACPDDEQGEGHLRVILQDSLVVDKDKDSYADPLFETASIVYSLSDPRHHHPGGWGFDDTYAYSERRLHDDPGKRTSQDQWQYAIPSHTFYHAGEDEEWKDLFYDVSDKLRTLRDVAQRMEGKHR